LAIVIGILSLNNSDIFELDSAPNTGIGVTNPSAIGDLAIVEGTLGLWQKFGNNNTDWILINTSNTQRLRMTALQSVTANTYTNVTELTSLSLPVGNYRFTCNAIFQSSVLATGMGIRIGAVTATLTPCFGKWFIAQNANGQSQSFIYDQLTSTTNITSASVPTANSDALIFGSGSFSVTVAGTVAIQIRSENNGTAISLRTGSMFVIEGI